MSWADECAAVESVAYQYECEREEDELVLKQLREQNDRMRKALRRVYKSAPHRYYGEDFKPDHVFLAQFSDVEDIVGDLRSLHYPHEELKA